MGLIGTEMRLIIFCCFFTLFFSMVDKPFLKKQTFLGDSSLM